MGYCIFDVSWSICIPDGRAYFSGKKAACTLDLGVQAAFYSG